MADPFDFSMLAAQDAKDAPAFAPVSLPPMGQQGLGLTSPIGTMQRSAGQVFSPDAPKEFTLQLEKMKGLQATMVAQNQANANPLAGVSEVKTDFKTGEMTAKFHQDVLEGLMRDHQQLNEIRGSFHQEAQRLQAQEAQARSNPWIQLATALSANMAQQRDMPGWVQGLGATAAQLNPNPDQLAQRRLQVLGQEAQIAERQAGVDSNLMNHFAAQDEKAAGRITAAETQRRKLVEQATNNLEQAISKGPGQMDPKVVAESLTRAGATKEEIAAASADLGMLAKNVSDKYQTERTDKATAQALASQQEDRRQRTANNALTLAAGKKSDEQLGIEAVAQSLANGELTSIRDVASMRGGQRALIFKRARELNPNFSTGEIDRKIKMEQDFTGGPKGSGLASFDTFLQHAGAVTETLKGIKLTDNKLLNHSLNWWRTNMANSPELARLETSLKPVGKEFEKFLLATGNSTGGALYQDDRKEVEALLNADKPLSVTLATLNQMGMTAQDKYTALNQQYKRVMKQDINHPFSDEAVSGAAKIGINIGGEAPTTSGPAPGAKAATPEVTATGPNGQKLVLRNGQWVPK